MNVPLLNSLIAIIFTQLIKFPIAYLKNRRNKVDIQIITATGGMPSSHSAAVSCLIVSLALQYGSSSPSVAIATVFGIIVMFDSMAIRRQSGEQGLVLDVLARHYLEQKKQPVIEKESHQTLQTSVPVEPGFSNYESRIINKYLGHKPTEVFVGALVGMAVAFVGHILFHQ
ncbi:hypothetical protein CJ205_05345 [Dolosicoccus paucivorans]|uniref:Divergent PAP2 family protein n=1 Tax=Dolosicoccus paucivorans TaxID=84521 RepID=A0A2N6SMB2_9LACT|nr:divergent PAP2 family protein [Dolosicoccus paucivorans]PMC58217.1 hypothetical protein CJ205_05345 [Dolosicoccus paucivorans]